MKNLLTTSRLSALACACASVCAAHSSAWAQALPQLKEVVISASRMEQALQTAPIGASVLVGEDIVASGVLDANEAVRKLAGVTARSDLNGGREASIDLRGFGDSAASNMVVLIDGVRVSENELVSARLSAISPDLIERIEIMRGGASVEWGEGATAGVINVVTKVGKAKGLSGSAQLGLESYGTRDARLALNMATEGATYFAQGRSLRTSGYRDNSANRNDALNLGLEAGDDKGLKVRLGVFTENQNARWPGALSLPDYEANPRQTFTPLDNGSKQEDRFTAAAQYRSGPWLFALDLAKRKRSSEAFNDYGSFGDQSAKASSHSAQISPRVNYSDNWGQTAVSAVLGVDKHTWDYTRKVSFSGALGADERSSQNNRATFAKADFLLPSNTRMVVGLRNEHVKQNYDEVIAPSTSSTDRSLKAWELGVNQSLATHWEIYGRTAKSYRIANVDENRSLTTPLRPQTAKDLEMGLRFNAQQSSAALRVFRQTTTDEIAYDNATFSNINLDPVRRTGLELEGRTVIARDWTLSGNLQSINAKFAGGANEGKTPPHIAKLSATARVGYAVTAQHSVEVALQHRGEAVLGNDLPNSCTQRIPARTTLDALYRFRSGPSNGWSVTAGVDNLTNAQTYSWAFTNAACSAVNVYPDAGRSFKVNARYQF
jgi:iron complex outermembrane recepter protein